MGGQVIERELWWVAAFLEGEGSFMFSSPYTLRIMACQADREPLDRLRQYLGAGTMRVRQPSPSCPLTKQPLWIWQVGGRRARRLMAQLRPLMCARRQVQIDKALARYAGRLRGGKGSASKPGRLRLAKRDPQGHFRPQWQVAR